MKFELVEEKVDKIIKEVFCLDELDEYNPNMLILYDLGADSLDVVDILVKLESVFGISISQDDIPSDCTILHIYNYVFLKLNK